MTKTPSFVTEIPLKVTPAQETGLNKRFEAARQVYNACLGEALRRLDLMRQSKGWQAARKLPKGDPDSDDPIKRDQARRRKEVYKALWSAFDLAGKYSLQAYAQQFNRCWLGDHLGSQLIKAISIKAFVWVKEYALDSDRGRPRPAKYNKYNSVESGFIGKEFLFEKTDNSYTVSWTIGRLWNPKIGKFQGKGATIKMEAIVDLGNEVINHGLNSRLKYVRLVRRELNGRFRFYAQLVCEGTPYQRFELGKGVVGLDLGPSTAAIVGPTKAKLVLLCEELEDSKAEERRLQRKLDRQRRANNPDNYNPDGTIKPRTQRHPWRSSNRQLQTGVKLREVRRKQREYRKSLHGALINEIIQMGDQVNLEKLSYKAWQKTFGKSVGTRAPGMFISRLKQKVQAGGGVVIEFPPHNTKFSQLDHQTREYNKKSLNQRWHTLENGDRVQRDLYSAFLAACLEDDAFNFELAQEKWEVTRKIMQIAVDDAKMKDKRPTSFGF